MAAQSALLFMQAENSLVDAAQASFIRVSMNETLDDRVVRVRVLVATGQAGNSR